jgi:hypothetical protein
MGGVFPQWLTAFLNLAADTPVAAGTDLQILDQDIGLLPRLPTGRAWLVVAFASATIQGTSAAPSASMVLNIRDGAGGTIVNRASNEYIGSGAGDTRCVSAFCVFPFSPGHDPHIEMRVKTGAGRTVTVFGPDGFYPGSFFTNIMAFAIPQ